MSATLLRVAALTHVGKRRERNEDCIAVGTRIVSEPMSTPWVSALSLAEPRVCLVADGMGGHPAGHVASRIAIEQLSAQAPAALASDTMLHTTMRRANQALFEAMIRAPARTGMGTTIAGLGVTADSVVVFNVGDSRIYRMSERRLEQISIDDSEEIMTSFASVAFPARALSQCLGGFPGEGSIKPHFLREQPVEECAYLLCSDGLHDMLSDGEIAQCLSADLEESVRNLFEGAMNAGGIDNISIIIARVEGGAPA